VFIFDESVPLGVTGFTIHVKMNAFYLAVFTKMIINIILLTFLMKVSDNDDPSLDG
jgi:hypothetical protein